MMGNFSFGDYFKEEAVEYAWRFLTNVLALPRHRLHITVFREDDEAERLWRKIAGADARIFKLDEKDNFWAMGETGPCGPCSEIIFDRGEQFSCGPHCGIGKCECDRWLEIWNLVFMQYARDEEGRLAPLPKPSIDTGMGLERIAAVLQDKDTNYETDLFVPIMDEVLRVSRRDSGDVFPLRVVADHIRACVFLISDGVLPSNEGRGYVLRRILRRAVRYGRVLGIEGPFMELLVPVVVEVMGDAYPELKERSSHVGKVLAQDEVRFLRTLEGGHLKAAEIIDKAVTEGKEKLPGEEAFLLYDTFGFPIDLTKDMAREKGLGVDEDGFERAMRRQKERSRAAGKEHDVGALGELLAGLPATSFTGYERLEDTAAVVGIVKDGDFKDHLRKGEEGFLVLDRTPFYAESGGQVADTGIITDGDGVVCGHVTDVQEMGGIFLHKVKGEGPGVGAGWHVRCQVNETRRQNLTKHHTATHLLHQALRDVLGPTALQSGSWVGEDRLRLDFSHTDALTQEQLQRIEDLVNEAIMKNLPVTAKQVSYDESKDLGAVGLFEGKYKNVVRVVDVGGFSLELCGGTHVNRTGEIGQFQILSESSIASGVRRVEGVAGFAALGRVRQCSGILNTLARELEVSSEDLQEHVLALKARLGDLQKTIEGMMEERISDIAAELIQDAAQIPEAGNRKVVASRQDSLDAQSLRKLGDKLKDLGCSVCVLGSGKGGRGYMMVMSDKQAANKGVDSVAIVRKGAKALGGSGGGKPHLAQAGGKRAEELDRALADATREAKALLLRAFAE